MKTRRTCVFLILATLSSVRQARVHTNQREALLSGIISVKRKKRAEIDLWVSTRIFFAKSQQPSALMNCISEFIELGDIPLPSQKLLLMESFGEFIAIRHGTRKLSFMRNDFLFDSCDELSRSSTVEGMMYKESRHLLYQLSDKKMKITTVLLPS